MELSNLQGQLKVAIQKHQIIVTKMKGDPQNASLKKQLCELQAEIVALSEKQKHVTAKLRKELEKQHNSQPNKPTKAIGSVALSSVTSNTLNVIPPNTRFIIASSESKNRPSSISVNTGPNSHGISFRVEKPTVKSSVVPTVPAAAQKIIHQVVPSIVNNLVASANSAANLKATVLFPSLGASHTSAALVTANNRVVNAKSGQIGCSSSVSSSVLVVPSPLSSNRPNLDSQTSTNTQLTASSPATSASFVLKLGSPIRVPQYPPPNCRTSSLNNSTVTSTVDSCGTVVTAIENVQIKKERKQVPLSIPTSDTIAKSTDLVNKQATKVKSEENTKMNFMTALGLINRDVLNELQSKRGERKRRTTANPQFSNAALEEKRKNAAALISAAAAAAATNPCLKIIKKSRGRSKLNISPPIQSPPPTPPSPISTSSTIAPSTTMSRIENGANIFISRNGTNLVITNTTTQCNSLNTLPVGVHHVRVKTEPYSTLNIDDKPLNCSKKSITPSSVSENLLKNKVLVPLKTNNVNSGSFTGKIDALIKPDPKNNILNGCLKTVLNKNGGILSEVVLCGICHLRLGAGSGDMLACIGCKRPYHTRCAAKVVPQLSQGNPVNKNAHWKCPKCAIPVSASTLSSPATTSSITLTVPIKTSFTHHQPWKKDPPPLSTTRSEKIAKEEEKQRLLKRRKDLNEEMTKFKEKRQRLAEAQAAALQKQVDLITANKHTDDSLSKLHETVTMVQNIIS